MQEDGLSSRSLPCQRVIEENSIIYVPNVEDKVLLTAPLIQHFSNSKYSDGKLSIKHSGQRVFFIVNKDEDVTNTAQDLRRVLTQNVCEVGRDFELELDKLQQCVEDVENNQVLVLVGDTFLRLIEKDVLNFNNISLLICDKCHYATDDCHPLNKIVRALQSSCYSHIPRVLALTTTLINRCCKTENLLEQVVTLMETFHARVTSSSDEELTKLYANTPTEQVIRCENYIVDRALSRLLQSIQDMIDFLPLVLEVTDELLKMTTNLVRNIIDCTLELGIKGGSLASLVVIKDLTMKIRSIDNLKIEAYLEAVLTQLYKFRHLETCDRMLANGFMDHLVCSTKNDEAKYDKLISPKLKLLLEFLKKADPKHVVIVFVKKPIVMIALHYILQEFALADPALKHIKSNFFDGPDPDIDSDCKTRELYFLNRSSQKVLSQFNGGVFNVALTCNMAERSVDSKLCDCVISFDPPDDFTEYIQTKSWCRNSGSEYILVVNRGDKAFFNDYKLYRNIQEHLKKSLLTDEGRMLSCKHETVVRPSPSESAACSSSPPVPEGPYQILKRYFNSLNYNDRYFKYVEYWYFIRVAERFKCFLKMPRESTCSNIEGDWCLELSQAKKSVEVEACKTLQDKGQLLGATFEPESSLGRVGLTVARLTPTRDKDGSSDQTDIGPEEHKDSLGRLFIRHLSEKMLPDCLMDCQPKSDQEVFLHVLHVNPLFRPAPENHRLFKYHQVLSSPHSFAVMSSKRLPDLAKFPLFMNAGEVEMELKTGHSISLNEHEIKLLKNFHFLLFDKMLGVAKQFLLMNLDMSLANYLIVPVKLGSDDTQMASVDWEAVAEMDKPFVAAGCEAEGVPSDGERLALQVTDDSHLGRLVSVWYRPQPAKKYLVTRICCDMSIKSSFPEPTYSSYEHYFVEKYRIQALSVDQPLIEVRPLSSSMSFIKRRTQSKIEKWKTKQDKEEHEVVLVPEFCRVWPVHGRYWLKALLLPSALHRVTQLCVAEQMRAAIRSDPQPHTGNTWAKLVEDKTICGPQTKCERSQELQPLAMPSGEGVPSEPWGREEEPPEPNRCLLEVNEFDLAFYDSFVRKPLWSTNAVVCESETGRLPVPTERDWGGGSPLLPMLSPHPLGLHPQQTTVLQALMPDCANDLCNNKRLEILGDAFIKLALSLGLFRFEKGLRFRDELASVRSALADTKNLYDCGEFRKSNMMLDIQEFSPAEEWVPPGFCVDSRVAAVITQANLNPHSLFDILIPDEERRSGVISDVTHSIIEEILLSADDATCIHTNAFLRRQALSEGQAAAAVRALVAAHLQDGGIPAALTTMNWFQVAREELIPHNLFEFTETDVQDLPDPKMYLWNYNWIQKVFHYEFSCLGHLLEAVTHPSYTFNDVTDCYGRLDFLGEAVIDFAITTYLHKQCSSLSAEEARSLRWALTDNVCAAALAVHHRLHTCLHSWSLPLARHAAKFAAYQCNRKNAIDSNLLLLTEDEDFDLNCCEVADVPSLLGSVFKSIVGAIFIDCGNDINTVWKSLYPLIKDSIDNLIKNVPTSHLKRLQDIGGCRFVEEDKEFPNLRHMARLEAYVNNVLEEFVGYGPTKEKAQQAAAKMALRKIRDTSVDNC